MDGRRPAGPGRRTVQPLRKPSSGSVIGKRRMRGTSAAWTASSSAAVTAGVASSPTPVGLSTDGMRRTSICGAPLILRTG